MKELEDVLDKITDEIRQIVDEETKHDEKWARGLHYSLYIINKYRKEESEKMEQVNEGGFYIKEDQTNPDYYKNQTSLECIEAMEIIFGRDAVIDFCSCNAWKYIWRWKNKNGNVDLDKANWYLERAYEMLDGSDKRLDMVKNMVHYVKLKMEESD